MIAINFWAVLAAAVAAMVVGSVWYGPLFGKPFMAATGMDKWSSEQKAMMKKRAGMSYFMQFVASLVMFYVLAQFAGGLGEMTAGGGMVIALWVWIGFIVPLALGNAIWGGKKIMFWLQIGNMLITLIVAGAIIGAWR